MGATGAAWATLLSQIAVFPLLLYLNKIRRRIAIKVRKPRLPEMQKFYNTAAPLFFFEAGMSTCYLLIESLSTQFGVLSAGAFRALWSPLSVLCFFTYPLKQAAQVCIVFSLLSLYY
jgi:Na+-driven multidrug efflux pump